MTSGATTVAYLVNQYPKVSHTFIRREIQALEARGVAVQRFALRGWAEGVADPADRAEQASTRYVLQGGAAGLLAAVARMVLLRPARFLAALRTCVHMARYSRRSLLHHLAYLAEACWLVPRLRSAGHLHVHFGTNAAHVAWLSQLLGGPPFSVTVHGPEEFDHVGGLGLPELLGAARFVVTISAYGRSQVWRWLPVQQWSKVHVVPCGLEADWLDALPDDVADENRPARLVCVGRLCEQKGQLLLVQAVAELKAECIPFDLVLVGDGEMRADIEHLIEHHGLAAHVRITGWVGSGRVREEILAARALVLPSFAEGLPVVLMEAMAASRPVVSTWIAGIPELVRAGVDGWLTAPGDLAALVGALREALQSTPGRLSEMGAAARERVRERHDVSKSAALLSGLFAIGGGTR